MVIQLYPPLAIHEQGRRDGNEDCIFPSLEAVEKGNNKGGNLFIVCDGVGGAAKGEEASRLTCDAFARYFKNRKTFKKGDIEKALSLAEAAIDNYIRQNEHASGMATTLALLFFHNEGATAAFVGDSRVYQMRNRQIIFQTIDHSLVNELVANNLISNEEALNHPQKNVVLRAVTGRKKPTEAETALLTDIEPGDYFFLCSDGILESFSNGDLLNLLGQTDMSDQQKIEQIKEQCRQHSRDNFSAFLLRVQNVGNLLQKEEPGFFRRLFRLNA